MPNFDFIEDETLRKQAEDAHNASLKKSVSTEIEKLKGDFESDLQSKIDEAVSGLKNKNDELLKEKKTVQEKLKGFEGITDPEAAREALEFIEKNREAQLLKDGKFEELMTNRVEQLKSDYESQIDKIKSDHESLLNDLQVSGKTTVEDLTEKLEAALNVGNTFKSRFEGKMVEDSLRDAALAAGVRPEAVSDILLRGKNLFTLGEDGNIESRGEDGKLMTGSDGSTLTTQSWIDGMKETAPHYWPPSEGAGASGGAGGKGGGMSDADYTAQLAKLADKGDMQGYNKLRAKQLAARAAAQ